MGLIEPGTPPVENRKARSQRWHEIVAELKALHADPNSDGWGMVGKFSPGIATRIRRGEYKHFLPEGEAMSPDAAKAYMSLHWEIITRKEDNGSKNKIWIRWIP